MSGANIIYEQSRSCFTIIYFIISKFSILSKRTMRDAGPNRPTLVARSVQPIDHFVKQGLGGHTFNFLLWTIFFLCLVFLLLFFNLLYHVNDLSALIHTSLHVHAVAQMDTASLFVGYELWRPKRMMTSAVACVAFRMSHSYYHNGESIAYSTKNINLYEDLNRWFD